MSHYGYNELRARYNSRKDKRERLQEKVVDSRTEWPGIVDSEKKKARKLSENERLAIREKLRGDRVKTRLRIWVVTIIGFVVLLIVIPIFIDWVLSHGIRIK